LFEPAEKGKMAADTAVAPQRDKAMSEAASDTRHPTDEIKIRIRIN
jgi:hypothetical protein